MDADLKENKFFKLRGCCDLPTEGLDPVVIRSSCSTVLFFLLTSPNNCGATTLGAAPCSQLLCQNLAFLPSPIVTSVEALKSRSLELTNIQNHHDHQ